MMCLHLWERNQFKRTGKRSPKRLTRLLILQVRALLLTLVYRLCSVCCGRKI